MSQYEPLLNRYPPASIPEIVAHIQKYLVENGVIPGVASVCGVVPDDQQNIPLKGSNIPLQPMSVQTVAQAIGEIITSLSNLNDQIVSQGAAITALGPYNGVDSDSTTAALSAAQGKALNDLIATLGPVNNLTSDSTTAALSAAQGKVLNSKIEFNLLSGNDMNLMIPVGNHCILFFDATNITNGPTNTLIAFGFTMKFDENNLVQFVMSDNTHTYTRYRSVGVWTEWAQL